MIRGVAALAVAAAAVSLVGCAAARLPSLAEAAAAARAGATAHATPIEIGTEAVVVEDGRAVTPCYTFDVPQGYVVERKSAGCQVFVNWEGGDGLTEIMVNAVIKRTTRDEWITRLTEEIEGVAKLEWVRDARVMGRGGFEAAMVDNYGLTHRFWVAFIPRGLFADQGAPISSVVVTGPWSEAFDPFYQEILDSFVLKEG
jgi:hypothetical protein